MKLNSLLLYRTGPDGRRLAPGSMSTTQRRTPLYSTASAWFSWQSGMSPTQSW